MEKRKVNNDINPNLQKQQKIINFISNNKEEKIDDKSISEKLLIPESYFEQCNNMTTISNPLINEPVIPIEDKKYEKLFWEIFEKHYETFGSMNNNKFKNKLETLNNIVQNGNSDIDFLDKMLSKNPINIYGSQKKKKNKTNEALKSLKRLIKFMKVNYHKNVTNSDKKNQNLPPISFLTLNQYRALYYILKGFNIFITGSAGSGKTSFLKYLCDYLDNYTSLNVVVTAFTGCAVSNLEMSKAQTFHSFIGGIFNGKIEDEIKKALSKPFLIQRIREADVVILDECGMMSCDFYDKVDIFFRKIRDIDLPLGGIQVIYFGDFLQLPPIPSEEMGKHVSLDKTFLNNSKLWNESLDQIVYFNDNLRQIGDEEFFKILKEIRSNKLSDESFVKLCKRIISESVKLPPENQLQPLAIYPKQQMVDQINQEQIKKLIANKNEYQNYERSIKFFPSLPDDNESNNRKTIFIKKINQMRIDEQLKLCNNLDVILTVNYNKYLKNGSRGRIVGFEERECNGVLIKFPIVTFDIGKDKTITNTIVYWLIDFPKNNMYTYRQALKDDNNGHYEGVVVKFLPLIPGKAITIHRSQSKTFQSVRLNLSYPHIFSESQSYVALSRATSLQSLWIESISRNSLNVFDCMVKFYNDLGIETDNFKKFFKDKILELKTSNETEILEKYCKNV